MSLKKAVEQLKNGGMIVIYDGDEREGEADLIFSAKFADPRKVEILRQDAGGLICAALPMEDAEKLGLPFFTDILEKACDSVKRISCRKTAYGDKPAFSLPVNHCEVYTGITDNDRALTLQKLDEVLQKNPDIFAKEFYAPGHIFLLIGRGLDKRKGHTELALELGKRAGQRVMVLCEMLGHGRAISKEEAKEYAHWNGLVFVEGKEVFE
jgi:3,4-dihydroxy 2-butanone 4-phosphate synthase